MVLWSALYLDISCQEATWQGNDAQSIRAARCFTCLPMQAVSHSSLAEKTKRRPLTTKNDQMFAVQSRHLNIKTHDLGHITTIFFSSEIIIKIIWTGPNPMLPCYSEFGRIWGCRWCMFLTFPNHLAGSRDGAGGTEIKGPFRGVESCRVIRICWGSPSFDVYSVNYPPVNKHRPWQSSGLEDSFPLRWFSGSMWKFTRW